MTPSDHPVCHTARKELENRRNLSESKREKVMREILTVGAPLNEINGAHGKLFRRETDLRSCAGALTIVF